MCRVRVAEYGKASLSKDLQIASFRVIIFLKRKKCLYATRIDADIAWQRFFAPNVNTNQALS